MKRGECWCGSPLPSPEGEDLQRRFASSAEIRFAYPAKSPSGRYRQGSMLKVRMNMRAPRRREPRVAPTGPISGTRGTWKGGER